MYVLLALNFEARGLARFGTVKDGGQDLLVLTARLAPEAIARESVEGMLTDCFRLSRRVDELLGNAPPQVAGQPDGWQAADAAIAAAEGGGAPAQPAAASPPPDPPPPDRPLVDEPTQPLPGGGLGEPPPIDEPTHELPGGGPGDPPPPDQPPVDAPAAETVFAQPVPQGPPPARRAGRSGRGAGRSAAPRSRAVSPPAGSISRPAGRRPRPRLPAAGPGASRPAGHRGAAADRTAAARPAVPPARATVAGPRAGAHLPAAGTADPAAAAARSRQLVPGPVQPGAASVLGRPELDRARGAVTHAQERVAATSGRVWPCKSECTADETDLAAPRRAHRCPAARPRPRTPPTWRCSTTRPTSATPSRPTCRPSCSPRGTPSSRSRTSRPRGSRRRWTGAPHWSSRTSPARPPSTRR